jgi:hypothetical protein
MYAQAFKDLILSFLAGYCTTMVATANNIKQPELLGLVVLFFSLIWVDIDFN